MRAKRTEHELYSGKRLKQFRRKLNLTRDDLEAGAGGEVTARTIGDWERRGIPATVKIKKLEAVCEALQLPNGLEDLEKVELGYLEELTLDVVQGRLESAADDIKAHEIGKIFDFIEKRQESEPEHSDTGKTTGDLFRNATKKPDGN